jgi:hypothetical protein
MDYNIETLTLSELIEKLENLELTKENGEKKTVRFDFGSAIPIEVSSWRGVYNQLALSYELTGRDDYNGQQETFVNDLIATLKKAYQIEFQGYKGGSYRMNDDTYVWVSNWGRADLSEITDVYDAGYEIVIITSFSIFY